MSGGSTWLPPDAPPARNRNVPASDLLLATPKTRVRAFKALGFSNPRVASANLEALTPTPRDAELLAPVVPRLLAELGAEADPDMALNNLERYAEIVDLAVVLRNLVGQPGAIQILVW